MRSPRTTRTARTARPARLVLAAAAAVVLTATLTACEDDATTPAAPAGPDGAEDGAADDAGEGDTDAPGSGHDGEPVTQSCGTTDLTFSVSEESEAGGYFVITAQAAEGISCTLEGTTPLAFFGSSEDSQVSAIESPGADIELSGDAVAYAGINPKTTDGDGGIEFEQLFIAIAGEDGGDAVEFPVSATVVDEAIASNWTVDPSDFTGYMVG
ncbi:DUF4232 domain-containing protein [Streptomyces sp. XM4011]|uniref:DUF4232 domain-containing protein n=1 Tax=Streptomyces sp. XM4011 TaxID=2929780 RepID=UPI001FF94531|nr:DUF4232 domain-containing protein [Streptomyces sp. XM4011]MCK1812818.1 DUF4232 domain-containing protein [Streptomyces sp. XM4011]